MKYTIHGFSQEKSIELDLTNDDLLVLRWFVDFKETGSMEKQFDKEKDKFFYWVKYSKIVDDLPILTNGSKNEEAKKKKIQRLLNGNLKSVLDTKTIKNKNGTKLFISINEENYKILVGNSPQDKNVQSKERNKCPQDKKVQQGKTETSNGDGQNCPDIDISISNPSNNNKDIYSSSKDDIEEVWNHYPNKKGKAQAIKKISKLLKKYGKYKLIEIISRYANEVEGKELRFVLNGSTFFNGRYMDYLEENYQSPGSNVVPINKKKTGTDLSSLIE